MPHYDDPELEPLTHVAIIFDRRLWSLPKPYRHHHILQVIRFLEPDNKEDKDGIQGFLDARGHFLTRLQAVENAEANNQIKGGKLIGSVLTSEDLW
jgi:hypothetical protein